MTTVYLSVLTADCEDHDEPSLTILGASFDKGEANALLLEHSKWVFESNIRAWSQGIELATQNLVAWHSGNFPNSHGAVNVSRTIERLTDLANQSHPEWLARQSDYRIIEIETSGDPAWGERCHAEADYHHPGIHKGCILR